MADAGGGNTGHLRPPWKPGESGNPSGRPKVERTMSAALAELADTPGATPKAVIAAYRRARGKRLCATDHKAIARFLVETNATSRNVISGQEATTDRLEGKIPAPVEIHAADLRDAAARLAEQTGLTPEEILAAAAKAKGAS